jgi:hypothetical protein
MLPDYDDAVEEQDATIPWPVLLMAVLWSTLAVVLLAPAWLALWLLRSRPKAEDYQPRPQPRRPAL